MTPQQFTAAWQALNLTGAELARRLGLSNERVIYRYKAGGTIPRSIQLLLAYTLLRANRKPSDYGLPNQPWRA